MYTGSLGAVSNNEDWTVNVSFTADDGTQFSMAGATFTFSVTDQDTPRLSILPQPTTTISADGLTATFSSPVSAMQLLPEGNYSVFVRMILAGVTTQLIAAQLSVVEGGPT